MFETDLLHADDPLLLQPGMSLCMAFVDGGADIPAEDEITFDVIFLDDVDDATTVGDLDLPATEDDDAASGVGEGLHSKPSGADGGMVDEVLGQAEGDVELVDDLVLAKAVRGDGVGFGIWVVLGEDYIGCI